MAFDDLLNSRRAFLKHGSLGLAAAAVGCHAAPETSQQPAAPSTTPASPTGSLTPGAPPAFGTAPPVGPEVSAVTFTEGEKLVQVTLTEAERKQAALNWRQAMAPLYEELAAKVAAHDPALAALAEFCRAAAPRKPAP